MAHLSISLLGTFEMTLDNRPVDRFRTSKVQALLIYLLINNLEKPESSLPREQIIEMLWPGMPPASGKDNLRTTLYQLRRAIPQVTGRHGKPVLFILGNRQSLRINPDARYELDVARFIGLHDSSNPEQLARGVALYRDDFLVDFYIPDNAEFEQWIVTRRARFRRDLLRALHRLAAFHLEWGDATEAEKYARRHLELDDLDERAHRQLLLALAYEGNRTAALAHYRALSELLAVELGVEPSRETKALYEAIFQNEPARWLQRRFSLSPSTARRVGNFPVAPTPFIGRQQELGELEELLADRQVRLVNIVGSGGSGKTRLAVEVATRLASRYRDGAIFVPLRPLSDHDTIPAAVSTALGLHQSGHGDEEAQLLNYLANKEMLLLLDNIEHLLPVSLSDFQRAPGLLHTILRQAPLIQVMVTSREVLHLSEEHLYPLDGLSYPQNEQDWDLMRYDAVQLFVERARRVRPRFSVHEQQAGLRRLCRLVAGIPLALELAANWVQALDCVAIAAEIERRLAFLTTRLSDVAEHHRSMQAVFDHSWKLLSDAEQQLLRQMSVFRGPCRLEAAAEIAGASASAILALVEKSLLRRTADGLYDMHELLRQYAGGKLRENVDEGRALEERFAGYYVDFLHERRRPIQCAVYQPAVREVAVEVDNVRAAWGWLLAQHRENDVRRILSAYGRFHFLESRFQEAATAAARGAALIAEMPPSTERDLTRADALNNVGYCQIRLGQFDEARMALEESRAIYRRLAAPPTLGLGSDSALPLAVIALIQGDPLRAIELAEPAQVAAKRRNDLWNLTMAHYVLSSAYADMGDYDVAHAEAQRSCKLAQQAGSDWFLGYALLQLGKTAQATGSYAAAKQHYEASASIRRGLNYTEGVAETLNLLGQLALVEADYEGAQQLFQEALTLYQETNDQGGIAGAYHGVGLALCAQLKYTLARRYLAEALSIASTIRFWPLVLSILVDAGILLLESGDSAEGIELLALAERHAAAKHETRTRAAEELRCWRDRVDAATFSRATTQGKEVDLESALRALQLHLASPLSFADDSLAT